MLDPALQVRVARAAQLCQQRGIAQADIAAAVGASQSQVSRILSGKGLRRSRLLEEVCLYVERLTQGVTADAVRRNAELVDAIKAAWDGSAAHARALSTVIRSLAVLRAEPSPGRRRPRRRR